MKAKYKPLAMKCNKEQFESIKDLIPLRLGWIADFKHYEWLLIDENESVCNCSKHYLISNNIETLEEFDGKYFLECCGIEILDYMSEQVWKGSDMQVKRIYDKEWQDCNKNLEYRLKPKPNINADIEALYSKAKELGIEIEIITK